MPLLSKVAVAHVTMALVASCFGGMNVILQWALQEQDPTKDTTRDKIGRATVFALYRDVGAAGLLLLMSILFGSSQWRGSAVAWRSVMIQICACGVLGIGAQLPYVVGISVLGKHGADTASVFQPMSPIATVAVAVLFGAERGSVAKMAALLLSIGGAVLTVDFAHLSADSLVGIGCLLLNVVGIAGWLTIQKLLLLRGVSFLPLIALTYSAGAVFVALIALPAFGSTPAFFAVNGRNAIALGYSVFLSSALCYFMIAWASQHLDPSYISLWQVVQPITTAILSLIFLNEAMTARQIGGGALIALGLVVCCVASLREERRGRQAAMGTSSHTQVLVLPSDLHLHESDEPYARMEK